MRKTAKTCEAIQWRVLSSKLAPGLRGIYGSSPLTLRKGLCPVVSRNIRWDEDEV